MNTIKIIIATLFAFTSISAFAGAADQIEGAIGAKIIAKAPSAAPGYKAILANKDGKNRVFYESNDGNVLFYGMIYDKAGNNLTALDAAKLTGNLGAGAAAPSLTPTAQAQPSIQPVSQVSAQPQGLSTKEAIAAAASAHGIVEGKGKPVYVIFDPNCPYCKQLHSKTRNYLSQSEIHWIPVGILSAPGGSSDKKSAAILHKGKPALDNIAFVVPEEVSPKDQAMLNKNLALLSSLNSTQVPMIISAQGVVNGLPGDAEVNAIFSHKPTQATQK